MHSMRSLYLRQLRTAVIVAALLVPLLCSFPVLALSAPVLLRGVIALLWLAALAALVGVGVRARRVLGRLDALPPDDDAAP